MDHIVIGVALCTKPDGQVVIFPTLKEEEKSLSRHLLAIGKGELMVHESLGEGEVEEWSRIREMGFAVAERVEAWIRQEVEKQWRERTT